MRRWAQRVNLLDRLLCITHERNLIGVVNIWCEDANEEMPRDMSREEEVRILSGRRRGY